MNPQALEGVPDAMSVSNLTQASLLHTVRERYNRDEVCRSAICHLRSLITFVLKPLDIAQRGLYVEFLQ